MIMSTCSIFLDSTSVATEYSLKFDESMTEDEIEEKSFRIFYYLLESHRRFNMERKEAIMMTLMKKLLQKRLHCPLPCVFQFIHGDTSYIAVDMLSKGMKYHLYLNLSCQLPEYFSKVPILGFVSQRGSIEFSFSFLAK